MVHAIQVLDFNGTIHSISLAMASVYRLHDFSEATNLRVLNLASVGVIRRMPSPLLLPPNLAELDLTGTNNSLFEYWMRPHTTRHPT